MLLRELIRKPRVSGLRILEVEIQRNKKKVNPLLGEMSRPIYDGHSYPISVQISLKSHANGDRSALFLSRNEAAIYLARDSTRRRDDCSIGPPPR